MTTDLKQKPRLGADGDFQVRRIYCEGVPDYYVLTDNANGNDYHFKGPRPPTDSEIEAGIEYLGVLS